jgi:nitrite reductase (NADH) large subunit
MTQTEQRATPAVGSALRLTQPTRKPRLETERAAGPIVPSPIGNPPAPNPSLQAGGGSRFGCGKASHKRERLVIVGAGMAALKLVEEIVSLCPGRYDIVLVGKEPRPPYNRVLLSSLLAGDADDADIALRPRSWFADCGVDLICGTTASGIHPTEREVTLSSGTRLAYDRVVLATGSNAIVLPIPGHDLPGVTTFRNLADVEALRAAGPGARAVVIGGGLLGIEAAYGLRRGGLAVTLVHLMPRLMERQLDASGAALLKTAVEMLGIEVILEAQTIAIEGDGRAERVVLKDGHSLRTDLVVMAAGVRAESSLAEGAGIEIGGRGILVDDKLETNWPSVYAIGECAEHRGICYGLVEPAHAQARTLAKYLAGFPARYEGSLLATNLKVSGVPVFSLGDVEGEGAETIVLEDQSAATYRKLVVREGRLVGAVLFGDTADALWYRDLMCARTPIAPLRDRLAFGRALSEREAA